MRIIAGSLKGRHIAETHGHRTHPMSEKIRGALFNALGDIEGLTAFDAFTGTGAVAVEAISRGAARVIAIDSDKEAYKTASRNAGGLNIKVTQANVSSWSDNTPDAQFDIVVADPPYDDVKTSLLEKLAMHTKKGGVFVISVPPIFIIKMSEDFELLATKQYGDAKLEFYRRIS